jgi:hypothetical protein
MSPVLVLVLSKLLTLSRYVDHSFLPLSAQSTHWGHYYYYYKLLLLLLLVVVVVANCKLPFNCKCIKNSIKFSLLLLYLIEWINVVHLD